MGLALGGLNLQGGQTRLPLPLGTLAPPPVDGVVQQQQQLGTAQARRRTAAGIPVLGVPVQQQIPEQDRVGVRALLRTPGEETLARAQGLVGRALGGPNRDGEVQTHKPTDGTYDFRL